LISRFTRIRVLNIEATLAENMVAIQNAQAERKRLVNQAVSNYLRQIAQAVQSYVSATEKLPSLQNIQAVENAVKRYSYSEPSPFVHPEPGKSFRTVTQFSGKTTKAIKNSAKTIIIYESAMASDGKRGVVFADGSVDRVVEAEFTRLLNISTQVTKTAQ
jgi:type II secretory pathway pseudopilin PulG